MIKEYDEQQKATEKCQEQEQQADLNIVQEDKDAETGYGSGSPG